MAVKVLETGKRRVGEGVRSKTAVVASVVVIVKRSLQI
jgi:hypothetical protein